MKIVYLTNDMNPNGGWGRYASDLIYGVKGTGHEVVILKEQNDGLEGIPVLKRRLGIFTSALKIRKFIKECDIIHALDGYPFGIIAWLANIGLNKRLIISVQGSYSIAPLYNWKTSFLLKAVYRKAEKIIAISRYTKNELIKKIRLDNVYVVNPGINLEKFYTEHIDAEDKSILSVGALKFRKGYHISIPAFAFVKKKIPELKYKIIGSQKDKNYFKYLQKLAVENGIENDVEFLDNLSDEGLKRAYNRAELFVLTSVNHDHHFEGFGLVFLEAAAAGLPVIGTKGNGIEDAVKERYNGILVEQNNIEKTATAITEILSDKEKQSAMSKNSHEWAGKNNLHSMVARHLDIYRNK